MKNAKILLNYKDMVSDMRILIAEDEPDLRDALTVFLEKNNFTVDSVEDGISAYEYATAGGYDAIILDVMMPGIDGFEALKRMRKAGVNAPVMMLTARSGKDDRISGFNLGADDYLPKPFDPDELICRVRAMLRRGGEYTPTVLSFGDLEFNCDNGNLSCRERSVRITGREFQLMELFMRHPNIVFSTDKIMEKLWDVESEAQINVVWVHISNLRKKLAGLCSSVSINVRRGLGYVLEDKNDQKT